MQAIRCDVCGGNQLSKEGEFYVCQYCKTQYEIDAAEKLLKDGLSLKIDETTRAENLLSLAYKEYSLKNYDAAEALATEVLKIDVGLAQAWELRWVITINTLQKRIATMLSFESKDGSFPIKMCLLKKNYLEDERTNILFFEEQISRETPGVEQQAWEQRKNKIYTDLLLSNFSLINTMVKNWIESLVVPRMKRRYKVPVLKKNLTGFPAESIKLGEMTHKYAQVVASVTSELVVYRTRISNSYLDAQNQRQALLSLYDDRASLEHAVDEFYAKQLKKKKGFFFFDPNSPVRDYLWTSGRQQ